jgi:putative DNA primase/helicase
MIANKLVNYASEINGKLEASIFKQIVSGEPITARLPYGQPMQLKQYAKLIFNCNELPKDVEHTNAYFRRFIIVPFDVTIPEQEQDKKLHLKIIENELSGVFNWVLEGLHRLLIQKRFTHCEAVVNAVEQYKTQSDSVKLFIQDNDYKNSPNKYEVIKDLYSEYRVFCIDDGFKPVNKQNFIKRLQGFGVVIEKRNIGNVAYLTNDKKPL